MSTLTDTPPPSPARIVAGNTYVHRHNMGKGLVALQQISAGSRIIAEKPIFLGPAEFYFSTCTATSERMIVEHINTHLDANGKKAWDLLSSYHSYIEAPPGSGEYIDTPNFSRFKTGGIPISVGPRRKKHQYFGVFEHLSWANHACHPNAQHSWCTKSKAVVVYALENIAKGEQITISYTPEYIVSRDYIKRCFGFRCFCDWCLLEADENVLRNNSEREIMRLKMREVQREEHPGRAMHFAYDVYSTIVDEAIRDYRRGLVLADAFDIAVTQEDWHRAGLLGYYSWKAYVHCEGSDSDAALRMKRESASVMRLELGKQAHIGKGKGRALITEEEEDDEMLEQWMRTRDQKFTRSREEGYGVWKWLFMCEDWPEDEEEYQQFS